ncbi:hypothetical protein CFter6_0280 [Collimonas fungivorans]|uniref:Uncharacterized protein n=1 Tax=Collimonas fungivorans TaxID=158899 RepID=A0A127P6D6_9BURK|nr:hypothetical protein CFter6_0280 [Collimonas fungivorans]
MQNDSSAAACLAAPFSARQNKQHATSIPVLIADLNHNVLSA